MPVPETPAAPHDAAWTRMHFGDADANLRIAREEVALLRALVLSMATLSDDLLDRDNEDEDDRGSEVPSPRAVYRGYLVVIQNSLVTLAAAAATAQEAVRELAPQARVTLRPMGE